MSVQKSKQLLTISALAFLAITLAVSVSTLTSQRFDIRNKAATLPVTTPTPPSGTLNPIDWKTNRVSFKASNFWFTSGNTRYYPKGVSLTEIKIPPDYYNPSYILLEATWTENGGTMKAQFYFNASTTSWWLNQIKTYTRPNTASWVFYALGKSRIDSAIGTPYKENPVDLTNSVGSAAAGTMHFENLNVHPFLEIPPRTASPCTPYGGTCGSGVAGPLPACCSQYYCVIQNNQQVGKCTGIATPVPGRHPQ